VTAVEQFMIWLPIGVSGLVLAMPVVFTRFLPELAVVFLGVALIVAVLVTQ
jgi:hypothetical protein